MGTEAGRDRERLSIDTEATSPNEVTLRLHGDLDIVTVARLRAEVAAHAADARDVVVDLSDVAFIDSTGLVLLMEFARGSQDDDWRFLLRRDVSRPVARLFEITRTERLFTWSDGER